MRFLLLYADADEEYRVELEQHLAPLKYQGRLEIWHVRKISAEAGLAHDFAGELENADIVLFLVSSALLDSPFCYSPDVARALARNQAGTATLVAVIVRPCDWRSTPLGKLQALPRDGKAISTWANSDEACTDVARRVRELIQKRSAVPVAAPISAEVSVALPAKPNRTRSIATSSDSGSPAGITFELAAARYLQSEQPTDNDQLKQERVWLKELMPHIGKLPLEQIDDASLATFVAAQRVKPVYRAARLLRVGLKSKSINLKLGLVRKILRLANRAWRDDRGLPLLRGVPLISMLKEGDEREARVMTWEEQRECLGKLPIHLERMARFVLQCGCQEHVVCGLRWEWEVKVPEPDVVTFVVPTKSRGVEGNRLLVCNSIARRIVEEVRGEDDEYVFVYRRTPLPARAGHLAVMNNTAWRHWRTRCGLGDFQVRDLRSTFAARLREAGVSQELRDELLWVSGARVRTPYTANDVAELYAAVEKVAEEPLRLHALPTSQDRGHDPASALI